MLLSSNSLSNSTDMRSGPIAFLSLDVLIALIISSFVTGGPERSLSSTFWTAGLSSAKMLLMWFSHMILRCRSSCANSPWSFSTLENGVFLYTPAVSFIFLCRLKSSCILCSSSHCCFSLSGSYLRSNDLFENLHNSFKLRPIIEK